MTVLAGTNATARHAELYRDAVVGRIVWRLGADGRQGGDSSAPEDGLDWLRHSTDPALGAWIGADPDPHWWDERIDDFEDTCPEHLALRQLDRTEALLLVAAGLIEADIRFGSLFASLQEPLAARRPCLGLLGWLLADAQVGAAEIMSCGHGLVHRGLFVVDNPADPRAEWVVRLPVALWDLLGTGSVVPTSLPRTLSFRPALSFPDLSQLVVPADLVATLPRIGELMQRGSVPALVVRGPETSGRLTLLGALARELGRDVLVHEGVVDDEGWRLLGPLAALAGAVAVTVVRPAPGTTLDLPALPDLGAAGRPVLGVVVGRHGGVAGAALDGALSVTLRAADASGRLRMWLDGGLVADEEDLTAIAEGVLLTPGNIHRAAPMAMAVAALDGRDRARPADVRTATATLSREALETLAAHLPPLTGDVPPVLSPAATDEVGTLLSLCRQRERLVAFAGAAVQGTGSRGVRALFSGPSGTGKTLAARYVASRLGLELYRVDLSAVVSKYIGETEQNLDQVLGRAEELDVVLLLDEGDALMTGRTEVGNANDRYANLETNFLLQRLETFDGIVIITSNAANRIDSAFQRRIDVTVDLTPPDPDARRQIWLSHLPGDHTVSASLLEEVARRCALTGGRIRNAALHACLLSLERGRPVDDDALLTAVRREYRRMGATFPLAATVVG